MKFVAFFLFTASLFAQTSGAGRTGGTGTQLFVVNQQTATYQTVIGDFQYCKTITVPSGTFTITLVASTAQPASGRCIRIINYGSGVITVAPSGQNINGSSSNQLIPAGTAAAPTGLLITSDGANYFAQDLGEGTATISTSGGTSGWSGLPLTFVTNATQYAAPVGGALTSTTEATVQLKASSTATVSGLQVTVSAALGVAATLTITLRDGAVSQALTCTTASGGTTCTDTTHTVSVTQGDLLDFLLVSSGTVTAGLPQIEIGYAVATSTGGGTIAAPPYLSAGGNLYVPADNMYLATLPSLGSYTNMGTLTPTVTTQANGSVTITGAGATPFWFADPSHTASIEAVIIGNATASATNFNTGVFVYDSTNSRVYTFGPGIPSSAPSLVGYNYTFSGSGNPAFSSTAYTESFFGGTTHVRASISGGIATFAVSRDGGLSFTTKYTESVGTISKIGYYLGPGIINLFSAVVN